MNKNKNLNKKNEFEEEERETSLNKIKNLNKKSEIEEDERDNRQGLVGLRVERGKINLFAYLFLLSFLICWHNIMHLALYVNYFEDSTCCPSTGPGSRIEEFLSLSGKANDHCLLSDQSDLFLF